MTQTEFNAMLQTAISQGVLGYYTLKWSGEELEKLVEGALPKSGGTMTGDLRLQNGHYGRKINLGDGDYVHFYEPTDDALEIKANTLNLVLKNGKDGFLLNGKTFLP